MTNRLILNMAEDGQAKDVGENVFLDDLSVSYKVFAFFYPSAMPDDALEDALRQFGDNTGSNLLVNIGRFSDPSYDRIVKSFAITKYPVLVVTGAPEAASAEGLMSSAFVRVDNGRVLKSPESAVELLQKLFTCFLQGEISQALAESKQASRKELLHAATKVVANALKGLGAFLDSHDFSVSLVNGTFEMKKNG
jgi:hypothetical protein